MKSMRTLEFEAECPLCENLYRFELPLLVPKNLSIKMTTPQTPQSGKCTRSSPENAFSYVLQYRYLFQVNAVCSETSICPFLLGEHDCTVCPCSFPSDTQADAPFYLPKSSRVNDRRSSRDLTSSLGDTNVRMMAEAFSPHHACEIETVSSDSESCPTMSSVSRSSTLNTVSDSLFDAESSYNSTGTSWFGEVRSKPEELRPSDFYGYGGSDITSSIEETPIDWTQYLNLDKLDPHADDRTAPAKCRLNSPSSSSLETPQPLNPTFSRRSPRAPTSHVCHWCGKGFKAKASLSRHLRERHSKGRKFGCNYCASTFTRKEARNRHVDGFHRGESRESKGLEEAR